MSDLQSKTPISDAAAIKCSIETGLHNVVGFQDMRALELAANGLRNRLESWMSIVASHQATGDPNEGLWLDITIREYQAAKADLAEFQKLQPSPHDAPRTETHHL